SGEHPEDVRQGSHLANLAHLLEEVLERELLAANLALELSGLVGVVDLLGFLDQRQYVAHPQNARGHPLGMEALELVEALSRRRVEDRLAGDGANRERGAA